ncbi:hypothetical protein GCM10017709_34330 [Glutamicibacter nicotianae]
MLCQTILGCFTRRKYVIIGLELIGPHVGFLAFTVADENMVRPIEPKSLEIANILVHIEHHAQILRMHEPLHVVHSRGVVDR